MNTWPWYELKYDLAETILPKLERYKTKYAKEGVSAPTWLTGQPLEALSEQEITGLQQSWKEELQHMVNAFRQILNHKTSEDQSIGYDEQYIQEGLDKFSKYFQHFWD